MSAMIVETHGMLSADGTLVVDPKPNLPPGLHEQGQSRREKPPAKDAP